MARLSKYTYGGTTISAITTVMSYIQYGGTIPYHNLLEPNGMKVPAVTDWDFGYTINKLHRY